MKLIFEKYESYIAHFLTITGLFLVGFQLYQGNEHKKWENYNAMNLRYYEWYSSFPEKMEANICLPFDQQSQQVKRWVRTYFNLYSEEYWLYLEGLIPKDMWEMRIDKGVEVNLRAYPILIQGYDYWKNKKAFNHPEGFNKIVEKKLTHIRPELVLRNCGADLAKKKSDKNAK